MWFKNKTQVEHKWHEDIPFENIKELAEQTDLICDIERWSLKDRNLFISLRDNRKLKKENKELKGIVGGNKEWYGYYQETLESARKVLETTKLHLELEKKAYEKLYMENRELESKLYYIERKVELLERE